MPRRGSPGCPPARRSSRRPPRTAPRRRRPSSLRPLVLTCLWGLSVVASRAAAAPDALTAALAGFNAEGPKGWSFTQASDGDGHSRLERYEAGRPEFERWTLLQQDGRAPTGEELRDYHEKLSRRSRGGTAPRLTEQFDLTTVETIAATPERTTYRLRLKPGEEGDATAQFLRATIVLHHATGTIESLALAATEPFAPTFGVRITEMRTTLTYSLPVADRPSLLLKSETRLRGRAFWIKSLDADMTVTFSDHEKAVPRRRRSVPAAQP